MRNGNRKRRRAVTTVGHFKSDMKGPPLAIEPNCCASRAPAKTVLAFRQRSARPSCSRLGAVGSALRGKTIALSRKSLHCRTDKVEPCEWRQSAPPAQRAFNDIIWWKRGWAYEENILEVKKRSSSQSRSLCFAPSRSSSMDFSARAIFFRSCAASPLWAFSASGWPFW